MKQILFLMIVTLWVTACGGGGTNSTSTSSVTQKGARVLGLDIADPAQDNNFNNNISLAKAAGVEAVTLHVNWNVVETSAPSNGVPVYDQTILNELSSANSLYSSNNLKLSITLAPIDTDGITVPPDLVNQAFYDFTSDPSGSCTGTQPMLDRFNQMVDTVLARFPNVSLTSVQIGNEVDIELLKNHAAPLDTLWNQYAVFVKCVRAHIKQSHPSLNVGITYTYAGLTGPAASSFKDYNRVAAIDDVGVTYYPLNADFTVKPSLQVTSDFGKLVSLYHDQAPSLDIPIFIQEVGLPTSSVNNSSDDLQQQFVSDVFAAWDTYSNDIPFLAFLRLNDLGTAVSTNAKSEYLRSLGLRTYSGSGTDKPGYCTLKDEAGARGWLVDGSAACP